MRIKTSDENGECWRQGQLLQQKKASLDSRSVPGKMASWRILMSHGLSFQNGKIPLNISDNIATLSRSTFVLNQVNKQWDIQYNNFHATNSTSPEQTVTISLSYLISPLLCTNYIHSLRCSYMYRRTYMLTLKCCLCL